MYTTHKCKACRSGQGVFKRVSRSNSRVFQKRLQTSSLLEGFASAKCFAKPPARRMVRDLKEKDDGGTTGGLSSAGTPHNNFCVHPAVHFRQGGGVAGGRGRQPQPSEGPFAAICRSACRTILISSRWGEDFPSVCTTPPHFVAKFHGHPAFLFREQTRVPCARNFTKRRSGKKKTVL